MPAKKNIHLEHIETMVRYYPDHSTKTVTWFKYEGTSYHVEIELSLTKDRLVITISQKYVGIVSETYHGITGRYFPHIELKNYLEKQRP